jgi:hypothetical protein
MHEPGFFDRLNPLPDESRTPGEIEVEIDLGIIFRKFKEDLALKTDDLREWDVPRFSLQDNRAGFNRRVKAAVAAGHAGVVSQDIN